MSNLQDLTLEKSIDGQAADSADYDEGAADALMALHAQPTSPTTSTSANLSSLPNKRHASDSPSENASASVAKKPKSERSVSRTETVIEVLNPPNMGSPAPAEPGVGDAELQAGEEAMDGDREDADHAKVPTDVDKEVNDGPELADEERGLAAPVDAEPAASTETGLRASAEPMRVEDPSSKGETADGASGGGTEAESPDNIPVAENEPVSDAAPGIAPGPVDAAPPEVEAVVVGA